MADTHPIQAGAETPGFSLSDQNGKSVSLIDYCGQAVVLYFYPKGNTPGCTKQAMGLTA